MTYRVQWTETVTCPACGKMGKIAFSGPNGDGIDKLEHGTSGFITESSEDGFQFRCTDCRQIARLKRPG